jgi:WD40 repeat protein
LRQHRHATPHFGNAFCRQLFAVGVAVVAIGSVAGQHSLTEHPKQNTPERVDRYGDPLPAGARVRFGTVRWFVMPTLTPRSATFSPDSLKILTCGPSPEIRTIDTETGKELARVELQWPKEPSSVVEVVESAFSSDCRSVAAIKWGGSNICFFDASSGRLLRRLSIAVSLLLTLEWSADGSIVAVQDLYEAHERLRHWDAASGRELTFMTSEGKASLRSGCISHDSKLLAGVVDDETVGFWDVRGGRSIRTIKMRAGRLTFSPDGTFLASIEEKGSEIKLRKVASGREWTTIRGDGTPITEFRFLPNGNLLAIADKEAFLWNVTEGRKGRSFPLPARRQGRNCFLSPDGKVLAFIDLCTLRLWSVATGQEFHPPEGHIGPVMRVAISPDGKILATTSLLTSKIFLWNAESEELSRAIDSPGSRNHSLAFSTDSKLIARGDDEGVVRLWQVTTGTKAREFHPIRARKDRPSEGIKCQLSADMTTLAALDIRYVGEPASLHIWETATGRPLARRDVPNCVGGCFSSDNELAAFLTLLEDTPPNDEFDSSWQYYVSIQDAATGLQSFKVPIGSGRELAFSADRKSLKAVWDNPGGTTEVGVWEVATGGQRVRFQVNGKDIRIDRSQFVVTSDDESFHIWDTTTGKERLRKGHPRPRFRPYVRDIALSQDSTTLLTAMGDRTILAWDLPLQNGLVTTMEIVAPEALEQLWRKLSDRDAELAYKAMRTLIATPKKAVELLKRHVHPATEAETAAIKRCIADLGHESFSVRMFAESELRRRSFEARPLLRSALTDKPSLDVRRRIESLLTSPVPNQPSESLAQLRMIEALEEIGNQDARQLLEALANGAKPAGLTTEARAALERLRSKPVTSAP